MVALLLMFAVLGVSGPTSAQRILTFRFRPTARAQLVLWIERNDGTFMGTLRLTEAVARRGIGNRPGAHLCQAEFEHQAIRRDRRDPPGPPRQRGDHGHQQACADGGGDGALDHRTSPGAAARRRAR